MRRLLFVCLCAAALITGCDRDEARGQGGTLGFWPRPYQPLKTKSTAELALSPETAKLVDTLATHEQIESAQVGYAGMPSETHGTFGELTKAASHQELERLLLHESPIVRGYVGRHFLRVRPEAADRVFPLLTDSSEVTTQNGCIVAKMTVGGFLALGLRAPLIENKHGSVAQVALGKLAVRGAKDVRLPAWQRAELLTSAAHVRMAGAKAIARDWLDEDDATLIVAALTSLDALGSTDVFHDVAPLAAHEDAQVRRWAAKVLGRTSHASP